MIDQPGLYEVVDAMGEQLTSSLHVAMTGRAAERQRDWPEVEIEKAAAERRGVIVLRARCSPRDDLNLAPSQPELEVRVPTCSPRASGLGRKIFAGQLSRRRLQYGDEAISVRLCVAITMPALRLRNVRSAP